MHEQPLGNWSSAHHLAQAARDMATAVREYRGGRQRAPFMSRTLLPLPPTDAAL